MYEKYGLIFNVFKEDADRIDSIVARCAELGLKLMHADMELQRSFIGEDRLIYTDIKMIWPIIMELQKNYHFESIYPFGVDVPENEEDQMDIDAECERLDRINQHHIEVPVEE